jgi:hypothetical protein
LGHRKLQQSSIADKLSKLITPSINMLKMLKISSGGGGRSVFSVVWQHLLAHRKQQPMSVAEKLSKAEHPPAVNSIC